MKDEWDRLKVYHEVNKAIGSPNPFEVYVVNEKEYRECYSKFIDVYREV